MARKFRYSTGNKIGQGNIDIYKVMNALEEAGKSLEYDKIKHIIRKESLGIIIDARSKAPSEDIRQSIWFIEKKEDQYPTTVLIGPRYYGSHRGQLAHTFEFGTTWRKTKDGFNRGYITARPFMRPAFDNHKNAIVTNVFKKIFKLATEKLK